MFRQWTIKVKGLTLLAFVNLRLRRGRGLWVGISLFKAG